MVIIIFVKIMLKFLTNEIKNLFKKYNFITKEFLILKFKKTYKNRYYRISRGKS